MLRIILAFLLFVTFYIVIPQGVTLVITLQYRSYLILIPPRACSDDNDVRLHFTVYHVYNIANATQLDSLTRYLVSVGIADINATAPWRWWMDGQVRDELLQLAQTGAKTAYNGTIDSLVLRRTGKPRYHCIWLSAE